MRPTIVIPGIKGTSLENFYPIAPVTTWSAWGQAEASLLGKIDFDSLALDQSGTVDQAAEVVTRPYQLLSLAYRGFVDALRGHSDSPVYLFPYDWRISITQAAEELVRYVVMLLRKPLTVSGWDRRFDFACHSMGGLVFRAFLAAWAREQPGQPIPLGKVVFVATPHLGSLDAVEALIRGETPVFGGQKELRKLARTFPAVYELLPRYQNPDPVVGPNGTIDVFSVSQWQSNIVSAIPATPSFTVEQQHLDKAKSVLTTLPTPMDPPWLVARENVLVVYGRKPESTLLQVRVIPSNPEEQVFNWYDFDHAMHGDGDSVVPVQSALALGVQAVEITMDEVSYFDVGARWFSLHAFLPELDEVSTIVSRFLQGVTGAGLLPKGIPDSRYKSAPGS